jgi:hypothetical protein
VRGSRPVDARAAWFLSAIGGAIALLAIFTAGVYGLLALAVVLAFAARLPQRMLAIGGVLVGGGGCLAITTLAASSRCEAFDGPTSSCVAYGAKEALVVGAVVLAVGLLLTLYSLRREVEGAEPLR